MKLKIIAIFFAPILLVAKPEEVEMEAPQAYYEDVFPVPASFDPPERLRVPFGGDTYARENATRHWELYRQLIETAESISGKSFADAKEHVNEFLMKHLTHYSPYQDFGFPKFSILGFRFEESIVEGACAAHVFVSEVGPNDELRYRVLAFHNYGKSWKLYNYPFPPMPVTYDPLKRVIKYGLLLGSEYRISLD